MKGKKLLSALIAGAMVIGTMSFPVFAAAEPDESVLDDVQEMQENEVSLFSTGVSWSSVADDSWYREKDENENVIKEFTLTKPAQLAGLAKLVNAGNNFSGKTIKLGADMDLNGDSWTPIGKSGKSFNGHFDGQNHTISNLVSGKWYQNDIGLFGFTQNGSVKNIKIHNAEVCGYLDVGVVAGTPYTSTYSDIYVDGLIKVDGMAYVGGAFGKNVYAAIDNIDVIGDQGSYVYADSIEDGTAYRTYVGGLCGFTGEGKKEIKNCDIKIDVEGTVCDIGGILGMLHYGISMDNCTYEGNLKSHDVTEPEFGVFCGTVHTGAEGQAHKITNCTATVISAIWGDEDVTETITPYGAEYTTPKDWFEIENCTINGKPISFINAMAEINGVKYLNLDTLKTTLENEDNIELKLYKDVKSDGIFIGSNKSVTIDLNGYTYTVSGTTVGSSNTENQGLHIEKDSNVTIKNGTITATAPTCVMLVQNYSNLTLEDVTLDGTNLQGDYVLSNNYGDTVLKGNTNIIAPNGGCAFDVYNWKPTYSAVSVTLDETMTGTIDGRIEFSTVDNVSNPETHKLVINGGTFTNSDVTVYTDNYKTQSQKTVGKFIEKNTLYLKDNNDGTYTVAPAEAKVIDTAKTTGAEITLDGLHKSDAVDSTADATYKVVVSTAPKADAEKANAKIKADGDTNTDKA
ncbi:MAG: hypothetical protein SOS24_00960, partial [Clostridia bacterium]|nr:hypothetical protein [Clostridia bacterium]